MNTTNDSLADDEHLATLGGGCFWCTEAIFQRLPGVLFVESGFSGGTTANPSYQEVSSGESDHAEVVQISYDPSLVSFRQLIKFHLASHDPTTANAQGVDYGPQYRSLILYRNKSERQIAEELLECLALETPEEIVTQVARFDAFYPAGSDHQNFYNEHAENEYCQLIIQPKLDSLEPSFDTIFDRNDQG